MIVALCTGSADGTFIATIAWPDFVIGGQFLLGLRHRGVAAFRAHHDLVLGVFEFGHGDEPLVAPRRQQRRLVDEVHQVGAGKARRAARQHLEIDIRRQRHLAHMHLEDLLAADDVGVRHDDLAVETARTQQRRIEHVRTVGRGDEDDALIGLEAVHLDEQLVERLLALVIAAAKACAAMAADRVDFVDEDDARRILLGLFEHVAHAACADADEHFDEVGARNREEGHVGLAGDRARQQRLAGAWRADEQHAVRDLAAEPLELLRIAQEFDDFLEILLGFVDAGDIVKGDAAECSVSSLAFDLPKPMALPDEPCIWRMKKIHTPRMMNIGSQLIRNEPSAEPSDCGRASMVTPFSCRRGTKLRVFRRIGLEPAALVGVGA